MVAAVIACAISRSDVPMFIWLLVFCATLVVEIVREWWIVTKPAQTPKTGRQTIKLVIGSYPYVAGLVFVGVLAYISIKGLLGNTIGSYEARLLGRIAFIAVGSVFVGTFVLFFLTFVVGRMRRR
jgi:hypothetical protein